MPAASNTDNVAKLSSAALAADPELRKRTQSVFSQSLRIAENQLRMGTDAQRSSIIKAIVPQLMRSLQDEAADERLQQERAAYQRLMAALRGDTVAGPAKKTRKRAPAKKRAPLIFGSNVAVPAKKAAPKK